MNKVKRKVLLNPGPATTTDTVKMAQIVPDICPREKEFVEVMKKLQGDLLKTVHASPEEYTAVLFCGSGTLGMDVCLNSLLPDGKKLLVINNGAYSSRAVSICESYHMSYMELKLSVDTPADIGKIEEVLRENEDIAVVYITHHETGTGILNPVREIGAAVHRSNAVFIVDTTSSLAMIPIDMKKDNIDFCMASAQKGIMAMTGLSFVIGNKEIIERSKDYPVRSYYCNLYMQYEGFKKTGEMRFTPPVQTVYAAVQGIKEYFEEGETAKWERHLRVTEAIHKGLAQLGFKEAIKKEYQSGLVVSVLYPDDPNWDFEKVHDHCYQNGFTIYPGKITGVNTFRLCSLGAIDQKDIEDFFAVFKEALGRNDISVPVRYQG